MMNFVLTVKKLGSFVFKILSPELLRWGLVFIFIWLKLFTYVCTIFKKIIRPPIQWKIFFLYIPTANICNLCTLFHDILLQKLHILLHSSLIRLLKNAFDLNFQCQHLNSLREFFWLVTVAQISYHSTYCSQLNPDIIVVSASKC